jgi:hypothetical protein
MIWRGLPPEPQTNDALIHDRWLLQLAAIHVSVNMHDWKHRASCFKGGKAECRYRIPKPSIDSTAATLLPQELGDDSLNKQNEQNLTTNSKSNEEIDTFMSALEDSRMLHVETQQKPRNEMIVNSTSDIDIRHCKQNI